MKLLQELFAQGILSEEKMGELEKQAEPKRKLYYLKILFQKIFFLV